MAKSAYEEWKMIYRVALEHIWKSKRPELRRVEMLLYCLDLECSGTHSIIFHHVICNL